MAAQIGLVTDAAGNGYDLRQTAAGTWYLWRHADGFVSQTFDSADDAAQAVSTAVFREGLMARKERELKK